MGDALEVPLDSEAGPLDEDGGEGKDLARREQGGASGLRAIRGPLASVPVVREHVQWNEEGVEVHYGAAPFGRGSGQHRISAPSPYSITHRRSKVSISGMLLIAFAAVISPKLDCRTKAWSL